MKIALIFPGIGEKGFNKHPNAPEHNWIHHGLCSLSACAKKAGHAVRLVDMRELSGWDIFRQEIEDFRPQAVGITMMSVDFECAVESARMVKSCDENIKVIVGGPHPSIAPDEVAAYPHIDHVVVGEGEGVFTRLLDEIERGRSPDKIVTGDHPELDALPFVDRELFRCKESTIDTFLNRPFVTIIAGRGCMYNCSFCQPAERKIFGKRVRRRSVANVIEELKGLRDRLNFQSFMFHDDCLAEDTAWVRDFCEAYRKAGFKKPFICQCRADIICKNEDLVGLMKRSGLAMFLIGFESGSQRILSLLRKGTTVEVNMKAARICRKYGIRIWANYMLGMPTETNEEIMDTVAMMHAIKPYRPSPAFFTPHPGSDLYDRCVKDGLLLIRSWRDYARSYDSPKVKGVDYDFVRWAFEESKKRFLPVRLYRKFDFIRERRVKPALRRFVKFLFWYRKVCPCGHR